MLKNDHDFETPVQSDYYQNDQLDDRNADYLDISEVTEKEYKLNEITNQESTSHLYQNTNTTITNNKKKTGRLPLLKKLINSTNSQFLGFEIDFLIDSEAESNNINVHTRKEFHAVIPKIC